MVSFTTAILALLASTVVSATTARTWSGTSCNSGDELNWSGHSVACESLGNVKSLFIDSIDPNCSITYYSDSNCSNDAVLTSTGQCMGYSNGAQIKSWSWDC
ncbi:uncharacterized protein K441DRAFT_675039 [Cenococcum geophilum 1.58]|uniref:uncharacterized protein n=1 Tax=Cenococcum geophilum 1.58 TaxID=794803 RepID=UPI00358E4BCC|nr:hypothetical protein K441DRAFT_675039 [Cenococcum geophilum 1.58]